jgi:hypothetical protein
VQDEATNNNNNEKLILVQDGRYETSKRMYAFAQYARYIRPDAYRVDITESHLLSTAYVNKDGSTVVVILNPTHEATDVSIDLGRSGWVESVRAYVTDQDHEMEEVETSWEGGVVTARVTERGLITFRAE